VSVPHTTPSGHAPGFRAIRFNMDWITRPLFGFLLAGITIVVVFIGPRDFAILIALAFIVAALEWHRCVSGGSNYRGEAAVTAATVAAAEAALLYSGVFWAGLIVVALGMAASFVLALRQDKQPLWQAAGVPYLAVPALSLVALCALPHGAQIVIGMMLIVWATDTGALICGNLIGGPRIAPKLSPGKTWAGTIGGSVCAALVYTLYINFLLGHWALWAAPFAFLFSFAAHGGDLFESLVKRRFGLKDSGAVIPGHGGVLDRIDSMLAAAPVMALLVLVAHINPLFGVHL
jgi:phosphatidate cytidylyltransferase